MTQQKVGAVNIVYRGEERQFTTVSQAMHFLRRDDIKTGWFRKIEADVEIVSGSVVERAYHLKGEKFNVIAEIERIERAIKRLAP
jgi:hypothetical protein